MINFENKVGFENNLFPTIFFYWKWTRIVPSHMVFIERQPLHQSSQSRRGAKPALWSLKLTPQSLVTDAVHFYSVGGVFKVTLQSLVILNLLTIRIPYLYDVSADEKHQIRRQSPGRERHADNRSQCCQAELKWGNPNSSTFDGPRQPLRFQREILYPWQTT